MKRINTKGFTLVELLAVIVILALLIVVVANTAMPVLNNAKKRTLETYAKRVIEQAKSVYMSECIIGNNETKCDSAYAWTIKEIMGEDAENNGYEATLYLSNSNGMTKVDGAIIDSNNNIILSVIDNKNNIEEDPFNKIYMYSDNTNTKENLNLTDLANLFILENNGNKFLESVSPTDSNKNISCGNTTCRVGYNNNSLKYIKVSNGKYLLKNSSSKYPGIGGYKNDGYAINVISNKISLNYSILVKCENENNANCLVSETKWR